MINSPGDAQKPRWNHSSTGTPVGGCQRNENLPWIPVCDNHRSTLHRMYLIRVGECSYFCRYGVAVGMPGKRIVIRRDLLKTHSVQDSR